MLGRSVLVFTLVFAWLPLAAQTPPPDPALYGAFPQNYKEVITTWLESQLLDAASAKIEWMAEPYATELPAVDGKPLRGYRIDFRVNSRNRFGAYTGMQRHGVLIHDGVVIKGLGFGY